MSNCHDTKLKFFGIARLDKKESADEGLYLVGSIQVSLIRLPNGNCAVHEPNLKRGYMILNKNSLSKIVDYICDKLSKQISQKFPEKKLSSVSVAPYTVKKRISLDFAYSGSEVLFGGTARIRSKTPTGTPKRRDSNDNAESAAIGLERSRSAPHF